MPCVSSDLFWFPRLLPTFRLVCFRLLIPFRLTVVPPLAKGFVDLAVQKDVVTVIRKDLSWLWRTAYNTAVQGCTDWGEEFEAYATALFRVARDVRQLCSQTNQESIS